MRILFLTQVLPYPPDSGGKIKAFNLLKYLSRCHQVVLLSFIRSPEERKHISALARYCTRIETVLLRRSLFRDGVALATSLPGRKPFLMTRDWSRPMVQMLKKVIDEEDPDVVHAIQLNMAQYALLTRHIPTILDQENAVSQILERVCRWRKPGILKLLAWLEWRKLLRYEGEISGRFNHILTVSEEDKQVLASLMTRHHRSGDHNQPPVTVIPIGVDCQETQPLDRGPDVRNILALGTMFYPPNADGVVWFAQEVYPHVTRRVLDANLYVIGARPPKEVMGLAQKDQTIKVTGYVEDATPYVQMSAMLVVPLRIGGGMRVKILDAWAQGIPVVSTSVGAEGIEYVDGENILIADGPAAFAQAVVSLLQDAALAQRLSENGRRWVQENYDWRTVYREWDTIYQGLCV